MIVTNLSTDFDIGYVSRGLYKQHPTTPGIYTSRGVLPSPAPFSNSTNRSGFCSLVDVGYTPSARSEQAVAADTASSTVWSKPYLSGTFPNMSIGIAPGGVIYTAPDGGRWFAYTNVQYGSSNASGSNIATPGTACVEVRLYPFGEFGKASAPSAQTIRSQVAHQEISSLGYLTAVELDVLPDGSKIIYSTYAVRPIDEAYSSYVTNEVTSPALCSALLISIAGVPPSANVTLTSLAHDGVEGDPKDIKGGITFVDNRTYGPPSWELNTQEYSKTTTTNGLISGCFLRPDGTVAYMGSRFSLNETLNSNLAMRARTESDGYLGSTHPIYQRTSTGSGTFEYEVFIDATIIKTFNGSYSYALPLEEMNIPSSGLAYHAVTMDESFCSFSFDGATTTNPAVYAGGLTYTADPGWWWNTASERPSGSSTKFSLRHPSNNMFMFTKYEYSGYLTKSNASATATLMAYGTPASVVSAGTVTGVSDIALLRYGSRNPETGEVIVAPYPVCYV